ncbi:MAG: hypothetical protein ACE5K7_03985 [Phycisphaerae bacterium]
MAAAASALCPGAAARAAKLANAPEHLDIPTYDGSGYVIHPDVLIFQQPWHGHTMWMAATPYRCADYENPSIFVSEDGIQWVVPEGLTNPLVPDPNPEEPADCNSDTDIVYDPGTDTLHVYYREWLKSIWTVRIRRLSSADGVVWSGPVTVMTLSFTEDAISPAVIRRPDDWAMWARHGAGGVALRSSSDGLNWSEPVLFDIPLPSGFSVWHLDVTCVPQFQSYWALINTVPYQNLYLAFSRDGLTWRTYEEPVLSPGPPGSWDEDHIYRSSLIYDPDRDVVRIWYSARDHGMWPHIGYVEAPRAQLFCGPLVGAGDLDHDGDVDLADFALLAGAFSGSGVPTNNLDADLDGDDDCDLTDLDLLVSRMTGPQ